MLLAVLFGVFIAVAAGSECPMVTPIDYFNMTAYVGEWYEVARYSNGMKTVEKCHFSICTTDGNTLNIATTFVDLDNPSALDAFVWYADASKSGNLSVRLVMGSIKLEYNGIILFIDYDKYAVVYNCNYDEKTNSPIQMLWIYGRNRTLEGKAKSDVENYMKSSGFLDFEKLIWIDNSEEACKPVTNLNSH